jgi:hypothetical protein
MDDFEDDGCDVDYCCYPLNHTQPHKILAPFQGHPNDPIPGLVHDIADQYELMREEIK